MEEQYLTEKLSALDQAMLALFKERLELTQSMPAGTSAALRAYQRDMQTQAAADTAGIEQYVHSMLSTVGRLCAARSRELSAAPGTLSQTIDKALEAGADVFPRTGSIACQGIEGANSQAACEKLFPRGHITFLSTFSAVFEAIDSGLCEFGVLPIENSSNGSVRAVYELLHRHCFSVVRSTRLCIRHELLAKPGTSADDITVIYSHEQALGQCSRYLSGLSGVRIVPCANTAIAAKMVADSPDSGVAAISSHPCAALYGLSVVSDDIQDSENNYTRFICITREPRIYAGANRMSFIFTCGNRPGALYEILSRFADIGVNLAKLESCPVTGRDFEFMFFAEADASPLEPGMKQMLDNVSRSCDSFTFLGCYAES